MRLSDFCIKRPAFTIVLSLLLITIGIMCQQKLSQRYLPKITVPIVTISTDYPGASSSIVETQLTNVLEDSMSGLSGLKSTMSTSQNGNSQIILNFKLNTDLQTAVSDVRANVAKVVAELPPGSKSPVVSKSDPNTQPILYLAYFNPNESIGALTTYVKQFIVPRFSTLPDVAKVVLWSSHYYALRISLNPAKMAARNVTVSDVKKVLTNQNSAVPTGEIKGNQLTYSVVTDLKLHRAIQFGNLVIKDVDNHVVRLNDVAKIRVGSAHRGTDTSTRYFSVDGKPGVAIGLSPAEGANNLTMTDTALRLFNRIGAALPKGMKQIVQYNQSNFTRAALYNVYEAIIEAFVLVLLVISLFLGSFRAALIPIVTVPICLLSSFAVIYFLGYSINTITLLALVLAIGLVVDDAIIMLENIARFIESGENPLTAAFKGSKQMLFPIVAMTITLAAVYAPVGFTSGISGVFFRQFAFTLLGAVLISGVVALTLSPMMCSRILTSKTQSSYTLWVNRIFERLQASYSTGLIFLLARSRWILTGIVVLGIVGMAAFYHLPRELVPGMKMPLMQLNVTVAAQSSFKQTQSFIPRFEKILNSTPGIQDYLMQNSQRGSFSASITLKPSYLNDSFRVAKSLQDKLNNIPGTIVTVSVASPPLTWFIPSSSPGDVELNLLTTGSYLHLHKIMQNFLAKVKLDQRFIHPDSILKWDTRQINIHINRDLAADLNVPIGEVTDTLQTMLAGIEVGKYDFGNQSFDVIMQLSNKNLNTVNILNQLYIHSDKQKMIPLQSLISISQKNTPPSLSHYNRLRSDMFTAKLAEGFSMGDAIKQLEKLSKQILPSNVKIAFSGSALQYIESSNTMLGIFVLALVFIYLILAAQFESFVDPFIILICVPFAVVGALVALRLTGNSINLYSEIGLVTLVGLIAKHGILITEFANQQLATGKTVIEAVTYAAKLRLRPILMTTAAMVLGALPLALAFGPGSENRQQIGWVIVAGLLLGTLVSLVIVPSAYVFVHSFKHQKTNNLI